MADKRICAVALDFDGVIANLEVDWNDILKKVSRITGQNIKNLLTFYETNFGTPTYEKVSAEIEKIELQALEKTQIVPYIDDFLKNIFDKAVPIFIVSMQTHKLIKVFLEQYRLDMYVTEIVDRERFPSKRNQLEYVIEAVNGRVIFVDDLKRNLISCEGLNAECFYFPRNQNKNAAKISWNSILKLIN